MRDIITTALGPDGSRIHIDKSIAGDRYGGIAHHQKCQLYPVFRHRGWRSSFAHMPNRTHCAPPSGESPEHKNVKRGWLEFLQDQLSGCFVCVAFGRNSPHLDCPVILTESSSVQPFYTEIAWVCGKCLKPHLYNVLAGAALAVSEKWQYGRRTRPDITILNEDNQPLAFVEFKKSSLSKKSESVAREKGIPLFVVDVSDGHNSQNMLNNPERRWYDDIPEIDAKSRKWMRQVDSIPFPGSGTQVDSVFDDDGTFVDSTIHTYNNPETDGHLVTSSIPLPKLGHYLLASRSTLGCESQKQDFEKMEVVSHQT